jgi:hypothetical protein
MMRARCSRSCGQGEDVVGHVITLNPERVLDDLGGMVAVVALDCLFKKVGQPAAAMLAPRSLFQCPAESFVSFG